MKKKKIKHDVQHSSYFLCSFYIKILIFRLIGDEKICIISFSTNLRLPYVIDKDNPEMNGSKIQIYFI